MWMMDDTLRGPYARVDHGDGLSVRYFMRRFMSGVNRTWPHAGHRFYNSAKPGSVPEYFSVRLHRGGYTTPISPKLSCTCLWLNPQQQ